MKTATVPAQITTVEDKIAGNLTIQQIALLASPIFIDFTLYALLPSPLRLNFYKVALMAIGTALPSVLAIRIRDKILLVWIVTVLRYNARPRYHVFNKNEAYLRNTNIVPPLEAEANVVLSKEPSLEQTAARLSEEETFRLGGMLEDSTINLSFSIKRKGELYVSITEIE